MLISNNSSTIFKQWFNSPIFIVFACVYVCHECLHVWMHIHLGCTCTGAQVCRGQRLTSGLLLYCSLPWVLSQDLLLPTQLAQGIPCLSLGDRITEKVPHLVFMLVLGSEPWFSHMKQVLHELNHLTSPLNSLCCFAENQLTVCMYWVVSGFCGTELPTVLLVLRAGILQPGRCFSVYLFQKLTTVSNVVPFLKSSKK